MAMKGTLAMTCGERERLKVTEALQEGRLTQRAAGERLGLSMRR